MLFVSVQFISLSFICLFIFPTILQPLLKHLPLIKFCVWMQSVHFPIYLTLHINYCPLCKKNFFPSYCCWLKNSQNKSSYHLIIQTQSRSIVLSPTVSVHVPEGCFFAFQLYVCMVHVCLLFKFYPLLLDSDKCHDVKPFSIEKQRTIPGLEEWSPCESAKLSSNSTV